MAPVLNLKWLPKHLKCWLTLACVPPMDHSVPSANKALAVVLTTTKVSFVNVDSHAMPTAPLQCMQSSTVVAAPKKSWPKRPCHLHTSGARDMYDPPHSGPAVGNLA
jgi:hypothetical protein